VDHVTGQTPAGVVTVGSDLLVLKNGEARMNPIPIILLNGGTCPEAGSWRLGIGRQAARRNRRDGSQ